MSAPETAKDAVKRLFARELAEGFKPIAGHAYRDADGKVLFLRPRLKHPDGRKFIRPIHLNGEGRYILGEPTFTAGKKPLYRLDELVKNPGAEVWVVEGEMKADGLAKIGILATTSGGSSSADAADWRPLAGRTVTIWPDHDEAGMRYAAAATEILLGLGCTVRALDVAKLGLQPKGDAVDWLAAHPDATAADVQALPVVEAIGAPDQPMPLPELPPAPPFPLDILPDAFGEWIEDAADRARFPADFAAVASMAALGSLIGRKLGIRLKQRDDWTEYGNIWGAVVGAPATLKSPGLREALRPLKALQVAANADFEQLAAGHKARLEAHKLAREAIRKAASKVLAKNPKAEVDLTGPEEPEEPVAKTYWTSNVNEASLGVLAQQNPDGLLIERDELSSLLTSLEDDNKADLRGMLLSGWSGAEGYRFDRIARGRVAIPKYAISIIGGIQPGPLSRYVRGAFRGERADGMLQRFQLLVWPDCAPFEYVDRYPKSRAKDAARAVFERVDTMDPLSIGTKDDFGEDPPFVRLSGAAQDLFSEWYSSFMRERRALDAEGAESGPLAAHFGKYPGLVGKLALILHVADDPDARTVSERTLLKALAWVEYLAPHACRAYHAADCPETGAAHLLLARARKGELPPQFKAWEIYRKAWHGLTDREAVKKACRLLFEFGWLVEIDPGGSHGVGRPADPLYALSPAVKVAA